MKRVMLTIAIAIIAALGMQSTASAANCTFVHNVSGKSGNVIYYTAPIGSCTDVEAVRWVYYDPAYSVTTGWYDYTAGAPANGKIGSTTTNGAYADYTITSSCTGVCTAVISQTAWWFGACRLTTGQWFAKIKRAATHTWGSTVSLGNPQSNLCF